MILIEAYFILTYLRPDKTTSIEFESKGRGFSSSIALLMTLTSLGTCANSNKDLLNSAICRVSSCLWINRKIIIFSHEGKKAKTLLLPIQYAWKGLLFRIRDRGLL